MSKEESAPFLFNSFWFTDPEEFGILGIDVTYNIGDFYITTTSYQHLSMIDKSTGKHPTFPGPIDDSCR